MEELVVEVDSHIATVTLNRPDRMNTITAQMLDEFAQTFVQLDQDPNVRVVILTGAGRAFLPRPRIKVDG